MSLKELIRRYSVRIMHQPPRKQDYQMCIEALNNLQTNAQYIKAKGKPTGGSHNPDQLVQVRKYMMRTGLSLEKLDQLSVIHVAGTKGKGTTCAFAEKILRDHGYTTGFYSSPHLLEVRERIRINGQPISQTEFTSYFWKIYSLLDQQKSDDTDMPLYFRFLTIMAFNVFVEKKVDVAIVEVGIGGEFDCTNVLRKVPVVGITSLGIDHVSLLGSTIESIAWNKAGIMKEGCRAFTVPQDEAALKVLKERSVEKNCHLQVVENLHFKFPPNTSCPTNILIQNASLAVALCDAWLAIRNNNNLRTTSMSEEITQKALATCTWPGRFQIRHEGNLTYHLDGAHTLESINVCAEWFQSITRDSKKEKALMFNVTGERNPENLLRQLQRCNFSAVIFVTNNVGSFDKSDNQSFISTDEQYEKCQQHKQIWLKLEQEHNTSARLCEAFLTIRDGIEFLSNQDQYDLLVTGSIHLIGNVLSILDPYLNE